MKNLIRKALAGWLSVLMVLGCAIPALAGTTHDYGSGSVSGAVIGNTGAIPTDVIEFEMPTKRTGMFNFIMDPHNMIALSGAALYKAEYGADVTFGEGKLFFQNITTSEDNSRHYSYSKRSDPLIVTNKSTVPLDVTMNLEVNKGGYSFQFADTPDFKDANGANITGDALYMALVSSKRRSAVQPVAAEGEGGVVSTKYAAELSSWIAAPDDAYELAVTEGGAYRYRIKADTPDSAFHSASFYLTGALSDTSWSNIGEEIDLTVSWDVQAVASESRSDPYPVPDTNPEASVVKKALDIGDTVKFLVDFGSGSGAMPHLDGVRFVKANGSESLIGADNITLSWLDAYEATASLTATAEFVYGSEWAVKLSNSEGGTALLPVELVAPDDGSEDPTATVVTPVRAANGTATLSVDWGSGRKAMTSVKSLTYTKSTGGTASISGTSTSTSISVNGNTIKIKLASTPFKGSDFVLVLANENGGIFEIPVDLIDTTPTPTPTPKPTSTPTPTPTLKATVTPKATTTPATTPKATVTPKATATPKPGGGPQGGVSVAIGTAASAIGDSVALTLNMGGNTDLQVKEMLYVMSGKTADTSITQGANLSVSGNTVTVKATTAIFKGSDWRIVLTNESGSKTAVIPFNLKTAATTNGVVVEVTTPAADVGDSATLSVSTTGSAYTTVQKLMYVMSGKSAFTSVSIGANLSVSGDTVTVKATTAIFKGSKWKLVFSDGSNTLEVPFELK